MDRWRKMHEHTFNGCNPRPLASYLKSLGLLRIVTEQRDVQAVGWWAEGAFHLSTLLDKEDLECFLCNEYSPTPIVSPWNGASGFYPSTKCEGMALIEKTTEDRFASYRDVISIVKSWPMMQTSFQAVGDVAACLASHVKTMRQSKKKEELEILTGKLQKLAPSSHVLMEYLGADDFTQVKIDDFRMVGKKKGDPTDKSSVSLWARTVKKALTQCSSLQRSTDKDLILSYCRAHLPDACIQWLDAICALNDQGVPSYNPLLGTGGNELKLDLSNSFMNCISNQFITGAADETMRLLGSALYKQAVPGLLDGKIGQYDPGRAGGYNQGMEVETKDFKINPWDFVLMLEGSLVLASAVARRNLADPRAKLTAPFTVHFSPVGFSSSDYQETGHKETWLPIWHNRASYSEVKHLFAEGRSMLGRKMARNGIDFARAVGSLGVDRGISAFERYAFLARRGQSFVAVPAGRYSAGYRKGLDLLDELDPLLGVVDFFLRDFKTIPATFQSVRRQIDETILAYCKQADAVHFKALIRALGSLERLIAMRDRSKKPTLSKPLFGLSPQWLSIADDGSPEVRIAASLASIRATGQVGGLRSNMSDVSPSAPWKWTDKGTQRAWYGNSLAERLSMALSRRLLDAERFSAATPPFDADLPLPAHDFTPFLRGQCDDVLLEDLLWGFTLINWRKVGLQKIKAQWSKPLNQYPLSRTWCLLKILHAPTAIHGTKIRIEPRIANLLQAGRVSEACDTAIRRLRVSELHPFIIRYEENLEPNRLAASLLFPVRHYSALESLVLEPKPINH